MNKREVERSGPQRDGLSMLALGELDALYNYLDQLPEDVLAEFMVKRSSKALEFYSEYHQMSLARTKLDWVTVE